MKRFPFISLLMAGLFVLGVASCRKDDITTDAPGKEQPAPGPENGGEDPGKEDSGKEDPGDDNPKPDDPKPTGRWVDTGADVPDWPSYNAVSTINDFPRVDITTDDGQAITDRHNYKGGRISFRDPKGMYSDVAALTDLRMQVRGRGNTTWRAEGNIKNPYRIKLDEKTKVFGMSGDRDWLLIADVKDATLLRNAVSQRIARLVSMPWSPRFRAVELYINGTYAGCYTLFEHKETGEAKIAVTPMQPGDTEGGFFLELDNKDDDDLYFWSEFFGKKIKYKDPDNPDAAQQRFMQDQVNTLERLLQEKNFNQETGWWAHAEAATFVRNFIVQELTKNPDGNMRLSTFFAKDADTKLFMPMCWDFDLALGNTKAMINEFWVDTSDPEGWYVKIRGDYPSWSYNKKDTYYQYMFQDPQFVALLKEIWTTVKPRLEKIPAYIDKMFEYNRLAFNHNDSAGKAPYIGWRGGDDYNITSYSTHDEAVQAMKTFYTRRLAWLDAAIGAL